jgi:hypothetical protein
MWKQEGLWADMCVFEEIMEVEMELVCLVALPDGLWRWRMMSGGWARYLPACRNKYSRINGIGT